MKLTCISAANVETARHNSASVKTCELIRDLAHAQNLEIDVEIVPLLDYEMVPCRMCGRCQASERCARDEAFNQVFEKMIAADALFIVVPHYAPLPSKLMILLEKMEEISFLNWCSDSNYQFPLAGRTAGVIGHGGQPGNEDVLSYYLHMVVEPTAMALGSVGINVVNTGVGQPRGVTFGIKTIAKRPNSFFVDITHDWEDIRERISPLVQAVVASASKN